MKELYSIHKDLSLPLTMYKSTDIYDKNNYFYFYEEEEAFLYWRSHNVKMGIKYIENEFNKMRDVFCHIFIHIYNVNTGKKIQYLLIDENKNMIINRIKSGWKTIRLLSNEWNIKFYYDIEKNNLYSTYNDYVEDIKYKYKGANILEKL